jgi:tight adherence protein C
MEPQSALEKNALKVRLANAASEAKAPMIYQGIRMVSLGIFLLPAIAFFLLKDGFTVKAMQWIVIFGGIGFYFPQIALWHLRTAAEGDLSDIARRTRPAGSMRRIGPGLDAAMRKVTDEMKDHAKTICEELAIANMQLQMGQQRREVLHDLGVRTGVDDMRARRPF